MTHSTLPVQDRHTDSSTRAGICLHIGCGLHASDGWENVDASPSLRISKLPLLGSTLLSLLHGPTWPAAVQYGDIVRGLNLEANSCDLTFCAHVLEHLSLSDFYTALTHIHTYLKPGGTFRFIVPDLKQTVDTYLQQYNDPTTAADAARYFMQDGTMAGHPGSRRTFYLRLREALSNSRHQWMWDEPSLLHTLPQYGFRQVRRCYYSDWADSRFQAVESENVYTCSLGIEAIK